MTDTQMALLLANIWIIRHSGKRYSLAMSLLFLFLAIYTGWLK